MPGGEHADAVRKACVFAKTTVPLQPSCTKKMKAR